MARQCNVHVHDIHVARDDTDMGSLPPLILGNIVSSKGLPQDAVLASLLEDVFALGEVVVPQGQAPF